MRCELCRRWLVRAATAMCQYLPVTAIYQYWLVLALSLSHSDRTIHAPVL